MTNFTKDENGKILAGSMECFLELYVDTDGILSSVGTTFLKKMRTMAIDAAYLDERRRAPCKMRKLVSVAHMYAQEITYQNIIQLRHGKEDARWSSFNKKVG